MFVIEKLREGGAARPGRQKSGARVFLYHAGCTAAYFAVIRLAYMFANRS